MSPTLPLLTHQDSVHRHFSADMGEVEKSSRSPEHRALWRTTTSCVDGTPHYNHERARKDNSFIMRARRQKPFFRRNITSKDLAELQDAAPASYAEGPVQNSQITGVLFVIISTVLFSLAAVFVKINNSIPSIETGLFRSIYSIIFGVILAKVCYGQQPLPLKGKGIVLAFLFARGLTDFMASNLFYLGCTQLGLGLSTVILFTNPFWAAILAKLWLGESYGISDFALACIALVGVILSAWPSLMNENVSFAMVLLVLPCSFLQAMTYCLIRRIAGDVHFMQMTVAYGLCGVVVGSGVIGYGVIAKQPIVEPAELSVLESASVTLLNLTVAGLAIGAQIFLNLGCARIESTVAALIRTLDIPLALVFQYLVFGEAAKALEIGGAFIVLFACAALTAMKQHKANREEDDDDDAVVRREITRSIGSLSTCAASPAPATLLAANATLAKIASAPSGAAQGNQVAIV
mmetsp:Transcript_81307/g.204576  ORF Transcript_81307/g.204576 Transcript_81307/m.204576 type:complete len:463 (+) Transcript_81307:209-1597(+)